HPLLPSFPTRRSSDLTTSVYSGLLRLNDLVLAQPNNHISLYIAAAKARREKVYSQLIRPSFQSLLAACEFITFESIQEQAQRVEALALDSNARVSGLIKGERFHLPDHYVYPDSL